MRLHPDTPRKTSLDRISTKSEPPKRKTSTHLDGTDTKGPTENQHQTRKQNLQANSRSACQFWHKGENVVREIAHTCTLFFPKGSKMSLFSLYGQRFPRYWQFFKIAIFGQEAFPLAKIPEVAHILSFYAQGVEIDLIFTLGAAVSEILADFRNCHISA